MADAATIASFWALAESNCVASYDKNVLIYFRVLESDKFRYHLYTCCYCDSIM